MLPYIKGTMLKTKSKLQSLFSSVSDTHVKNKLMGTTIAEKEENNNKTTNEMKYFRTN